MKIGEAAKRTGLTEKAIRVYVDNGPGDDRRRCRPGGTQRSAYSLNNATARSFGSGLSVCLFRKRLRRMIPK